MNWIFAITTVLLPSIASAQMLPLDAQVESVSDFSGGLQTTISPEKSPKNTGRIIDNLLIDEKPGGLVTRNGYDDVGSTGSLNDGRYMFTFNKEDGTKEFIVSDGSSVLSTENFTTYILIQNGLTDSANLDCAQVRNKVWCTNGTDSVFTWNGTTRVVLNGLIGTPNVPKGRYIEFYQERVFLANQTNNGSSLRFSDVVSTNGVAIAPDSFLAWPADNELFVGQGDGQIITALWNYRGQLQIGKDNSIHTLFGTTPTSYFPRKTESQTGPVSNDFVEVLDGLTYFKAKSGIYDFNGNVSRLLSDGFKEEEGQINVGVVNVLNDTWDSQSEFLPGQFGGTTRIEQPDYITVITSLTIAFNQLSGIPQNGVNLLPNTSTSGIIIIPDSYSYDYSDIVLYKYRGKVVLNSGSSINPADIRFWFKNLRTSQSSTQTYEGQLNISAGDISYSFTYDDVSFTRDDLSGGNLQFGIFSSLGDINISAPWKDNSGSYIELIASTTGQYISDISTLTNMTAYSRLDANHDLFGGDIDYFVRSSTSLVNIATQVWVAQTPGTVIGQPDQNNYFQWASTISAISRTNPARIGDVTINYFVGSGNKNRSISTFWKNRLWVAGSTESSGAHTQIFVKSKKQSENEYSWTTFSHIPIRSFAKDGEDTLYGGSATEGKFYRLDYGTNDDGFAIQSIYAFQHLMLKSELFDKEVLMAILDVEAQSATSLTFKYGYDEGSLSSRSVDISGSGRVLRRVIGIGKKADTFQYRIESGGLDIPLEFNGLHVIYKPTLVLPDE